MGETARELTHLRRQRRAAAVVASHGWLDPGQRRVAASLLCLEGERWRLLLAGPAEGGGAVVVLVAMVGVFVIGVPARLGGGRRGSSPAEAARPGSDVAADPVEAALLAQAARLAALLRPYGVSPAVVQPVLVVDERTGVDGQVAYLTLRQLVPALRARATRRMRVTEVALADHVAASAPHLRPLTLGPADHTAEPGSPEPGSAESGEQALLDVEQVRVAALAAARARPIEEWLTFLDPSQLALVTRRYSGPARISGPAGTGKTVVALHRLAHLSRRRPGRLLYVSYVRNLPVVQAAAFRRLAPDTAHRVEFTHVHAWARDLLASRGWSRPVDRRQVANAFHLAWAHASSAGALAALEPDRGYWREEVDHVIKGRGLSTLEQYLDVPRSRRRVPLRASARVAVWRLYEEYQRRLRERDAVDHNDVLAVALAEVRARPVRPGYDAVVVDEVQDIPLLALRLLHALVGDRPDGLLLVGDGQQAIYPGGFRLAEAGIPLRGRSEVLTVNYRNAAEVVREALRLRVTNEFDQPEWLVERSAGLGGAGQPRWSGLWRPAAPRAVSGQRQAARIRIACPGGRRVHFRATTEAEHDAALLAAIEDCGAAPGETVVITETHAQARHYRRLLRAAGVDTMDLARYAGIPGPAVKVGTVHRAKGLEFAAVLVPHPPLGLVGEASGAGLPPCDADGQIPRGWRDNASRHRLVAITRARDYVWLGHLDAAASSA